MTLQGFNITYMYVITDTFMTCLLFNPIFFSKSIITIVCYLKKNFLQLTWLSIHKDNSNINRTCIYFDKTNDVYYCPFKTFNILFF